MMNATDIKEKINRIGSVIAGWEQGRPVSGIEREWVLDQLRDVYGCVMFVQPEKETEATEKPVVEPQPEPVREVEDAVFVRQIDRRAILSLYDSECEPPPTAQEVQKPLPADEKKEPDAPVEEKPVVEPPSVGEKTIGEAFAANGDREIVAEKLAAQRPSGLRTIIELNDRFLLMKELFAGDASAYERAIDALDALTDFDEAIIHIHENYTWNPDCEGVKLMVELLTRSHGGGATSSATSTPN